MDKCLIKTVEDLSACTELNDFRNILISIREQLGFNNIVYAISLPDSFTRGSNLVVGDYPYEWFDQYADKNYINIDPVIKHCFSSECPYCWERFGEHEDEATRAFVKDAAAYGLVGGLSIGLPRFNGTSGLISVATHHVVKSDSKEYLHAVLCLNALHSHIHECIYKLTCESNKNHILVDLTDREKDCLLWTAEGKTASEIAHILDVSESTVTFHIKNAIRKLKVSNRSQAIAKAVLEGYIMPQFKSEQFPTYHF
jgi:DNA-binding CsgD family transcriptional regulator